MKVVLLTNKGSVFGKKILNVFLSRNEKVEAVVVINQPFKYYWKLFKSVRKRIGFFDAVYFSLKKIRKKEHPKWNDHPFFDDYDKLASIVKYTKGTNSEQTMEILRSLSPDILILGQTGIVKESILKIPKIGTLNAHPGILPYYRGVDCAKWAIYNNDFKNIGCTVHWVDNGVDTGNIILRERYDFKGNETLENLDDILYDRCISLLVDLVLNIRKGILHVGTSQKREEGKQYFKMSRKYEIIISNTLDEFIETIKK